MGFVWAPIEKWAAEWWERHHADKASRATLAVAEEHLITASSLVDPPRATPIGTLQWALLRVNWTLFAGHIIQDDKGNKWDLKQEPAAMLRTVFLAAWRRELARRAWANLLALLPEDEETALWGGVDFEPARRLFTTKGKMSLTHHERRRLVLLVAGEDAGRCWPLQTTCPGCQGSDGVGHRLWDCPFFQPERLNMGIVHPREGIPPEHQFAAEPITKLMCERLWLHEVDQMGPTHDWDIVVTGEPRMDALWYTDGSCMYPTQPVLARGAWSIVQMGTDDVPTYTCVENVTAESPQTATSAEQMAGVTTVRLAGDLHMCPTIYSDCQAVLASHEQPERTMSGKIASASH